MSSANDSQMLMISEHVNQQHTMLGLNKHPDIFDKQNLTTEPHPIGKQKGSLYSVIGPTDIFDPYCRAAFDGDIIKLNRLTEHMRKQQKQMLLHAADVWNLNLIAFFLAVQNLQIHTANKIYKKYPYLREIILNMVYGYCTTIQEPKDLSKLSQGINSCITLAKLKFGPKSPQFGKSSQSGLSDKTEHKQPSVPKLNMQKVMSSQNMFQPVEIVSNTARDDDDDFEVSLGSKDKKSKTHKPSTKGNFDEDEDHSFDMRRHFHTQATIKEKNFFKLALNMNEDRVAAFLVARYPVSIDDKAINYALLNKNFIFLHNVFFYEKTYLETIEGDKNEDQDGQLDENKLVRESVLTIETIIHKVNDLYDFHTGEEVLGVIMSWKFPTNSNILQLLCDIGHERVAVKYMNDYTEYSNWEFFYYCVQEEKSYFLKHALKNQFFEDDFMNRDQIIYTITHDMQKGLKIIFNLNLLLFTDFRKWNLNQLRDFNSVALSFFVQENFENSHMLIAYNPIMAIALMIQFLHFNVLDMECIIMIRKFEILGRLIIEHMKFDDIELIFMQKDFKERPVLQIITNNYIKDFIVKSKLKYLLDKIWQGKYFQMVDGKLSHFSKTQYLMNHSVKRMQGVEHSIGDILGSNFKANIDDYNFAYQLVFRQESINLIQIKEFLCATLNILTIQYINYLYLNLFTREKYKHMTTEAEQIEHIQSALDQYSSVNFLGILISALFFLSGIQRLVYNQYAKKKIESDIWLYSDIISGIINIAAFMIIGNAQPSQMLDQNQKWSLDYYMNVVIVMSWMRYFSYFMIIHLIAKMTITLFRMLLETLSFFVILASYLILMTTIFMTLFRDATTLDSDVYDTILRALREMVDYFTGEYSEKEMANYNLSHSILYMVHTFIANVFLLNYMVAIISTVYQTMIDNGDFYAITFSYTFVSKYIKALREKNGYEKLILYPPPLNLLIIPIIIFSPNPNAVKVISKYLERFFFWFENIFVICGFITYLIAIDMVLYWKIFFEIFKVDGIGSKLIYSAFWMFGGFFYLIYINLVDTCTMFNILCFERSLSFSKEDDDKKVQERYRFYVYRDCVRAIKQLYELADTSKMVIEQKQHLQQLFTQKLGLKERVKRADRAINPKETFMLQKDLVVSTYAQISWFNKFTQRYRTKHQMLQRNKTNSSILTSIQGNLITQREQIFDEPQLSQEFKNLISDIMQLNKTNLYETDPRNFPNLLDIVEKNSAMINIEEKLVRDFLRRFEYNQKGQNQASINLALVRKIFPKIFLPQHVDKMELINFSKMQKVLIKFYNDNQDEMFTYYDNRMSSRFNMIKNEQDNNNEMVEHILNDINIVNNYMEADLKRKGIKYDTQATVNEAYYVRNFSFKKPSNKELNLQLISMNSQQTRMMENQQTKKPTLKPKMQHLAAPPKSKFSKQNPPMDSIQTEVDTLKDDTNPTVSSRPHTQQKPRHEQIVVQKPSQNDLKLDMLFNPFVMNSPNLDQLSSEQLSNVTGPNSFDFTLSPGNQIFAQAQQRIIQEQIHYVEKAQQKKKLVQRRKKQGNKVVQNYIENMLRTKSQTKHKKDKDDTDTTN